MAWIVSVPNRKYKFLKEWIQYVLATAESHVYFGLLDWQEGTIYQD